MIRRVRKAKIIATLGPTSSDHALIRRLFAAGVDIFRLNFSHGKHSDHAARYNAIRELERESNRPVAVLADLQGPKLRVGRFEGGRVTLSKGRKFRLDLSDSPGGSSRVQLPHKEIYSVLAPGTLLLLDDGRIRLRVKACDAESADTVVETGGPLTDNKGVNLPHVTLPIAALTDKDRLDLEFAISLGVDWVALSFVQRPEDLAEARRHIGRQAALMAKLEKPAAITKLSEIIDYADGVMVARGDLGVELAPEDVPGLQKEFIGVARAKGKPVVVATQMLESMVNSPAPTRAEASDVATAVYDGADAVMLSAETASGSYPVEAVTMMDRIITRVEQDPRYRQILDADQAVPEPTGSDAITAAARRVAHTIGAAAIVTFSVSGSTTLRAARERPEVPILGLTSNIPIARRLTMVWGVHSVLAPDATDFSKMVETACQMAHHDGFAKAGDSIVITAGIPFGTPGATNTLRIVQVTAPAARK